MIVLASSTRDVCGQWWAIKFCTTWILSVLVGLAVIGCTCISTAKAWRGDCSIFGSP